MSVLATMFHLRARGKPLAFLMTVFAMTMQSTTLAALPPYGIQSIDYLASHPITDYLTYPNAFPSVEFSAGNPGAPAVCWPRSASARQVKVVFKNPTLYDHDATLTVSNGTFTNILNQSWTITVTASPTTLHFAPLGTAETTLTFSGMPNKVEVGSLQLPFSLVSNVTGLAGAIGSKIFLTNAAPTSIQSLAWTNVLDDACAWAINQTSAVACAEKATQGLYNSGLFIYDPGGVYYSKMYSRTSYKYRLKQLFLDRGFYTVYGDCRDVSNYLHIALKSLGVSAASKQVRASYMGIEEGFITNPLCGIGGNPSSLANYQEFGFNYHQVTMRSTLVYDAAAAQWLHYTGASWAQPPVSWDITNYWQTYYAYALPGQSNYLGLVNRYPWSNYYPGEPVTMHSTAPLNINLTDYTEDPI